MINFVLALATLGQVAGQAGLDIPKTLIKPVPPVNQVLARVNGFEIKSSDVEALLWEWRKNDVLNDIISYQLVRGEADKNQIKATDDEVNTEMLKLMEGIKSQLPKGQTMEQAMEQEGTAPSRLFLRVKTEILLRKIILRAFDAKDYVKVSTIVVKPAGTSADDLKVALEKADKAYNRLVAGNKWEDVLMDSTDDARARASLGLVGWRPVALFPDSVRLDIGKLKKNGYTKPAPTVNGIQIFRLDALGKEATAVEMVELQESYVGGQRAGVMSKLRADAKIEKF